MVPSDIQKGSIVEYINPFTMKTFHAVVLSVLPEKNVIAPIASDGSVDYIPRLCFPSITGIDVVVKVNIFDGIHTIPDRYITRVANYVMSWIQMQQISGAIKDMIDGKFARHRTPMGKVWYEYVGGESKDGLRRESIMDDPDTQADKEKARREKLEQEWREQREKDEQKRREKQEARKKKLEEKKARRIARRDTLNDAHRKALDLEDAFRKPVNERYATYKSSSSIDDNIEQIFTLFPDFCIVKAPHLISICSLFRAIRNPSINTRRRVTVHSAAISRKEISFIYSLPPSELIGFELENGTTITNYDKASSLSQAVKSILNNTIKPRVIRATKEDIDGITTFLNLDETKKFAETHSMTQLKNVVHEKFPSLSLTTIDSYIYRIIMGVDWTKRSYRDLASRVNDTLNSKWCSYLLIHDEIVDLAMEYKDNLSEIVNGHITFDSMKGSLDAKFILITIMCQIAYSSNTWISAVMTRSDYANMKKTILERYKSYSDMIDGMFTKNPQIPGYSSNIVRCAPLKLYSAMLADEIDIDPLKKFISANDYTGFLNQLSNQGLPITLLTISKKYTIYAYKVLFDRLNLTDTEREKITNTYFDMTKQYKPNSTSK